MIPIIYSIGIVAVCAGVGTSLLKKANVRFSCFLEEWVYAVALGLMGLACYVFLLGIYGGLYSWSIWAGLIAFGGITFRHIRGMVKQARQMLQQWSWSGFSRTEKILLLLLGLFAFVYLLIALAPPNRWDGIHYLFPVAQAYIRQHRIYLIPYVFAIRPKNMVMLYMVGYLLHSEILAVLFNYMLTGLCALLIYVTAKKMVSREHALLATTIFYSMPLTQMIASGSLSESGMVLYGFLAFCAFLRWCHTLSLKWIFLTGLFTGFTMGFKVIGIEVALIIGLLLIGRLALIGYEYWWQQRPGISLAPRKAVSMRGGGLSLVIWGIGVCTLGGSWYVVAYSQIGTPLYSGENSDYILQQYLADCTNCPQAELAPSSKTPQPSLPAGVDQKQPPLTQSLRRYSSFAFSLLTRFGPKKMAFFAWKMSMGQDYQKYFASPLYLAYLPLLLLFPFKKPGTGMWSLIGILYFVIGINLWGDYIRYVIPLFPVCSILVALTSERVQAAHQGLARMINVSTICIILLHIPVLLHAGINHSLPALGIMPRDVFLSRHYPGSFQVIHYANEHLPKEAKVLLLGETRIFLLEREWIVGGYLSMVMQTEHFKDADNAYQRMKALGITHVLVNQQEGNNTGYADPNGDIERFILRYLQEIYHDTAVYLYELKETP